MKLNIKPIAITIIVIGFLFLLKFQFPHYRISSNHMLPTLLKNDVVLVNKFIKGNSLKNNDICVFKFDDKQQISRIVGLPGDKLEIVNGVLFVNDVEQSKIATSFTYKVLLGNHPPLAEYDVMLLLQPSNQYEEYTAELTNEQAKKFSEFDFVKSISKVIHPKGYYYTFSKNPIFPNKSSFNWSRDNYGPLKVPKNCCFVLGDNRHQSLDSRYWGFVKEDDIIGKMMATIYSSNE